MGRPQRPRAVTACIRLLGVAGILLCSQSPPVADAFAVRPAAAKIVSGTSTSNSNRGYPSFDTSSFVGKHPSYRYQPISRNTGDNGGLVGSSSSTSTSLKMCICINCARVTSCQGYYFVESMHSQPHMDTDPKFDPQDGSPTIHVNYRTAMSDRAESEYERMLREHKGEEKKAEAAAGIGASSSDGDMKTTNAGKTCEVDDDGQPLHGEEKYDLSPVTTVEYDVVECADYVEDMGVWVRNMPEEIRRANPNFVPT